MNKKMMLLSISCACLIFILLTIPAMSTPAELKNADLTDDEISFKDTYYNRQILNGINVPDKTLESFARFSVWLEEQGVDAEAEEINLIYIDDDLKAVTEYAWVFAAKPDTKQFVAEKIAAEQAESESLFSTESDFNNLNTSFAFFEQKYPVKYVHTGLVTFITVENKKQFVADFSEEDEQMLKKISDIIDKSNENIIAPKWSSSNPDMHGDMARWAAEKNGLNESQIDLIADNAAAPDNWGFPWYQEIWEKNYKHFCGPIALNIGGTIITLAHVGGAPGSCEEYVNIAKNLSNDSKYINLGYSTHFMCDISNPLHTGYVIVQAPGYLNGFELIDYITEVEFSDYHAEYETYVGSNWTSGRNFSEYAEDVNNGMTISDPEESVKNLSDYSYAYSDTVVNKISSNQYDNSLFYATAFCIDEGQRYLIGLIEYGCE
ncbi:hypothetical protein [Methanolapillus ohkumae]|uniref:Uncharacterized protein n=1 Tax=Methanolapillus ohkumae TaxID=3028298 RepID=A0AA96V514_9EURY|nr:hypothetical protein MsAm2_01130 [Methanosarcinaceae archaeon Am2]